ncbi:MAG: radical SAM protein [Myxococcales bacterium]|nr:radical SAM protein [Myxococcales bacterium]
MSAVAGRQPCVLLISPGIIKWTDMDFGLPHLVSIGGYLAEHTGVRVELLDLSYEGGDHAHLERTLDKLGPFLMIGVSCYSSYDYLRVMTLARFVRRLYPDVPLVSGGYHASALPDDVVFDGSPFDAVVPGEGELPMREMVETLLGGGRLEPGRVYDKGVVPELDALPPYRWELLARYWPRAHEIGRKFQIYLARGCPYRCTFCMERAKSGYAWRGYSAGRAVDELARLARFTDLSRWVINIADPLFGFNRAWRREVLEGIIARGLLPRQYWTLTRSDDLSDVDVELLARANFSIGIGVESGTPEMLQLMQKAKKPERYLGALERLAELSRKHRLNWAANIIIGHPGETRASMAETHAYFEKLFTTASETCGWLSIDPFRLYPGSDVHERMGFYEQQYGTVFHHKTWWKSWYDAPFRAEHVDPSSEVDFAERVRFMYERYAPLVREIVTRFRGQGRDIDRVFQRSLAEQVELMSPAMRDRIIALGEQARAHSAAGSNGAARNAKGASVAAEALRFPIGLHVKDERVRRREDAVRRLLERGLLRSERVIEALLAVAPEPYLGDDDARAMLRDGAPSVAREGAAPPWLGISCTALALEALGVGAGDRAADLLATRGYVAALLAAMVGAEGEVVAVCPGGFVERRRLKRALGELSRVRVVSGEATTTAGLEGAFDGVWLGAALPRAPRGAADVLHPGGRFVTLLGPRFRAQDLVCLTRNDVDGGRALGERLVARVQVPVVAGPSGWLRA